MKPEKDREAAYVFIYSRTLSIFFHSVGFASKIRYGGYSIAKLRFSAKCQLIKDCVQLLGCIISYPYLCALDLLCLILINAKIGLSSLIKLQN